MLPRLDRWLARRAEIASRYIEALRDSRCVRSSPRTGAQPITCSRSRYSTLTPDAIREQLVQRGVAVGRHYPSFVPTSPPYRASERSSVILRSLVNWPSASCPCRSTHTWRISEVEAVIEACLETCA